MSPAERLQSGLAYAVQCAINTGGIQFDPPLGSPEYAARIRSLVGLPVITHDFRVDPPPLPAALRARAYMLIKAAVADFKRAAELEGEQPA